MRGTVLRNHRQAIVATFAALSSTSITTKTFAWSAANMSTTNQQQGLSSTVAPASSFRSHVTERLENSWIAQLKPETEENLLKSRSRSGLDENDGNQTKRPVLNGHYVPVRPTPLTNPRLVLWSKDVAFNVLGLNKDQVDSDEFLKYVSGNEAIGESWATPYALSIMGTRYTSNCPYGTGDGYGDGRAISIGEFNGAELQLKGAGKTPFCRGADGRAVLRSSIREFLASEAMHHLGVPTTRALSLVVSATDKVQRPWYREDSLFGSGSSGTIDEDDPRLAQYSKEERQQIVRQVRRQYKSDPNVLVSESAAITCRVCRSFTRIGHIDLFARRAEKASMVASEAINARFYTGSQEWKELEEIIWHACYREFRDDAYAPYRESNDIEAAATVLLTESANRLATMVGHWIRVGFAQ